MAATETDAIGRAFADGHPGARRSCRTSWAASRRSRGPRRSATRTRTAGRTSSSSACRSPTRSPTARSSTRRHRRAARGRDAGRRARGLRGDRASGPGRPHVLHEPRPREGPGGVRAAGGRRGRQRAHRARPAARGVRRGARGVRRGRSLAGAARRADEPRRAPRADRGAGPRLPLHGLRDRHDRRADAGRDAFAPILARAHACTSVPVALGFGIGTPDQAAAAADAGADGVIIGSRLVRAVAESPESPSAVRIWWRGSRRRCGAVVALRACARLGASGSEQLTAGDLGHRALVPSGAPPSPPGAVARVPDSAQCWDARGILPNRTVDEGRADEGDVRAAAGGGGRAPEPDHADGPLQGLRRLRRRVAPGPRLLPRARPGRGRAHHRRRSRDRREHPRAGGVRVGLRRRDHRGRPEDHGGGPPVRHEDLRPDEPLRREQPHGRHRRAARADQRLRRARADPRQGAAPHGGGRHGRPRGALGARGRAHPRGRLRRRRDPHGARLPPAPVLLAALQPPGGRVRRRQHRGPRAARRPGAERRSASVSAPTSRSASA